jgi:hypothetical protein
LRESARSLSLRSSERQRCIPLHLCAYLVNTHFFTLFAALPAAGGPFELDLGVQHLSFPDCRCAGAHVVCVRRRWSQAPLQRAPTVRPRLHDPRRGPVGTTTMAWKDRDA